MLRELVASIALFWFSSVSLIFIAMIILFAVSYFYDYYVWSRTTPSMLCTTPPIVANTNAPCQLMSSHLRTISHKEYVPTMSSKKGAKWKKTSKKSPGKREKEIFNTDYESSSESLSTLNRRRRIDELLTLTKHISEKREKHPRNISPTIAQDDNVFSDNDRQGHVNYEDSDEYLYEPEVKRKSDYNTSAREVICSSSSCIPQCAQLRKSSQCLTKSITPLTIDTYKEITANTVTKELSMFPPSPHIALTGPGPGSFVANRAEPIITPSAYIDPPIYGNIMPVFHVGRIPPKPSCTETSTASPDMTDGGAPENVPEGVTKISR